MQNLEAAQFYKLKSQSFGFCLKEPFGNLVVLKCTHNKNGVSTRSLITLQQFESKGRRHFQIVIALVHALVLNLEHIVE